MQIENTEIAIIKAIQNSTAIKRGSNEKLLPFLTRSYESAAGLTPTIPSPDAIRGAVAARLNAAKAKGLARSAVTLARQAVKAIVPASPQLGQPGFIAARIAQAAEKPTLVDMADSALIDSAIHKFAPEAGRADAIAELARRGFAVAQNGTISRNLKKITK
ncbi:MAG: hypothetical protein ORN51_08275 [Akkermansiaceae bacterium]|nr:hypothetical protein [Akkermansiaceae bacterium]